MRSMRHNNFFRIFWPSGLEEEVIGQITAKVLGWAVSSSSGIAPGKGREPEATGPRICSLLGQAVIAYSPKIAFKRAIFFSNRACSAFKSSVEFEDGV